MCVVGHRRCHHFAGGVKSGGLSRQVSRGIVEAYCELEATHVLKTDTWISHRQCRAHVSPLDYFVNFLLVMTVYVIRGCYALITYSLRAELLVAQIDVSRSV